VSDGNIQAARTRLDRAVQRLTRPRTGIYHNRTMTGLSLYAELAANLAGAQGETRTPAKSLPPLWIDACQLLGDIDTQTHKWHPRPGTTPQRLHDLAGRTWRPQDTDHVEDIARTVDTWCEKIGNLIDPTARKYISAPCPSCGRAIVYHRDSGGDRVRQPALKWTANVGFECQACKSHWSPEQTLFFSRLLGFELPEGVLE